MKYSFMASILLITANLLLSCNGGGNSTVPAYTPSGKTDTSAYTGNTGPAMAKTGRGREIFETRCMACHGQNGNARKDNSANLQFSRLDSIGITQVIKNGRGAMPMFKDAIADSDIGHLAVYVKSLRK
jgi:mono/diheme cytochrome c family protein